MKKFEQWFTTDRRQKIQLALGSLAPLLIMLGFGTEGIWEQWLIITGAALQFVASLVNLVNLRGAEAWTVLRGAVYALGTVVSPALVLLGFYDEAMNAIILTGLSLGLGALSNILAVFTSAQQATKTLQAEMAQNQLAAFRTGYQQGRENSI